MHSTQGAELGMTDALGRCGSCALHCSTKIDATVDLFVVRDDHVAISVVSFKILYSSGKSTRWMPSSIGTRRPITGGRKMENGSGIRSDNGFCNTLIKNHLIS